MTSATTSLRQAKPTDRDRLVQINEAAWRTAYQGILDDDFLARLEVSPARWSERIASGLVLVSAERRNVVAYATWGVAEDEGWGEVQAVYVDPDHQRAGHGTRLLDATTAALADAGYRSALLWVIDANWPARQFYEKRGWKLAKPFRIEEIGGVQVTLVRYERDLRRLSVSTS